MSTNNSTTYLIDMRKCSLISLLIILYFKKHLFVFLTLIMMKKL